MKKIFLILFILLFVGSVLAYKPSQIINNNCIETSISKSCNGSIEFYSPRYYDSGFLGMGSKWKEINTNIESCFLLCDYKITTLPYDVEINKNEIKIGLENEEIKIKIKDAKISKVESNKITFDISNKELSAIVEYTFTESKISKLITITQINKETDFDYIEEITHSNKNKIKEDENLIIYDKNNKGMTKRVEKKSNNFETKLTSNEISNMEFPIYIDPSLIIDTGTSIGGTQTYDYVNITNGAVVTINSTGYWNVTANQYFYLCPTCIINGSMVKNLGAGCYYDDGSGCEGGFNGNGDGGKTGQSTGDSQTGGSGGGGGGAGQTCSSAGSGGGGGAGASIISDSNSRFGVFFGAGGGSGGGGGCSSGNGGAGQSALSNNGNGGAGIRIVSPNVNIYGKIYSDAGNGGNGGDGCNSCAEGCGVGYGNGGGGGSGGGSAGTILIDSANINITGATFSAIGGNGGSGGARGGSCTYNGNNGNQGSGGAGGRIKIFYNTISNSSFSYSVAGGSGASAGTTGSIYYLSIPTTLNVTLNYPLDNQNTNNTLVNFNCTGLINSSAGGIYLSNISLWTNSTGTWKKNMTLNVSDYVSYLNVNFTSKINSNEGARTLWSCEACTTDNVCQMSNENRTIIYTTNAPLISVNKPSGLYGYGRNGTILTMNYTISPKIANLDSCWYIYNNKRYNINCSNYLAQNVTQDNFTTNLVIYANDTAGNTASSYTYWNYSIFENSINYNSFASEYSTETYSLNANYDDNYYQVSSAGLNYNGTNYLATKTGSNGNYIFTSNVDISSASLDGEIKSFYWVISLANTTGTFLFNSSVYNQTIYQLGLDNCSIYSIKAVNFTALDERTFNRVNPFNFKASINYFTGSGLIFKNYNVTMLNVTEVNLCMKNNSNYKLTGSIQYYADNYDTTDYNFINANINNITQNISLYLLNVSHSTSFIVKVQDNNQIPQQNYYVYIYRYDAGNPYLVQVIKTDSAGKGIGFFETETVDYSFTIKDTNGTIVYTSEKRKIIPETTPYTLIFTVGGTIPSPYSYFNNLTGLSYSPILSYNQNNQIVSYGYSDSSTSFKMALLTIYYLNASGSNSLICNESSVNPAGVLQCDLTGNLTGTYSASAIIIRDNVNIIDQLIFDINSTTNVYGMIGLLGTFFLLVVCIFIFAYNVTAGIISIDLGLIFTQIMGWVNLGWISIISIICISILILIFMERG